MSKKHVFNDGVKNAEETGSADETINMPSGKKRPLRTG